jgi:carboxymethylenebutenolidase
MSQRAPGIENPTRETGFRVALAEYPGCGMEAIGEEYKPYAHLLVLVAAADAEVSPKKCASFAERAKRNGADLDFFEFEGAEHNYDDPSKKKQANPANQKATEETMRRAETLFGERLKR